MKLMNIILLFGLINNAYLINQEIRNSFDFNFLKIKTLWSYLTPEGKNKLIALAGVIPIDQDNANDPATFFKNVDPKILLLLLEGEEQSGLPKEQQDEIHKIHAKYQELLSEGFSRQECYNKLFSTILNQNGCKAIADETIDFKEVLKALAVEKKLHAIFN